ncbi:hypothetical protein LTR91_022148 [Friedmanniomyces endolithicus]|uniref:G domain-containing protein n=1 Tax=Friedmanniomyces endolithicus TaxID=329885 RepID=A0AAN6H4L8_9PEZI|nr:hypothetical protein LTR03_007028 [Friedmanniomyces endolithicus]KAK0941618.1 hypothetical protein LTR29_006838 [Friedmanniomyces endolithicus]KAK0956917.1 hypothetical protein LTR91_022148 [Friedmanniomyces endolithicus]KAK0986838.1 hypothetical protein LTS01_009782 [Friedmanniomyces endolithicus]
MWAASLGVFAEGRVSIEHRLYKNDVVSDIITQLLGGIQDALEHLEPFAEGGAEDEGQESSLVSELDHDSAEPEKGDTGSTAPQGGPVPTPESTSSGSTDVEHDETIDPSKLSAPREDVEEGIGRLIRLSIQLRREGFQQHEVKAVDFEPKDVKGNSMVEEFREFSQFQCSQHLSLERAQSIDDQLLQRLERTLLKRWRLMCYRSHHANRIANNALNKPAVAYQGPVSPDTLPKPGPGQQISPLIPSSTQQASLPDVGTRTTQQSSTASVLTKDYRPTDRGTLRASSIATSVPRAVSGRHDFPPAPKISSGVEEAECPLCRLIRPRHELQGNNWKSHVLRDLFPYICVFSKCESGDILFRSYDEWVRHLKTAHAQSSWLCTECQLTEAQGSPPSFEYAEQYVAHLQDSHAGTFKQEEIQLIVRYGVRREPVYLSKCSFCEWSLPTGDIHALRINQPALFQHIAGAHLKVLALISLPWAVDSKFLASSATTFSTSVGSAKSEDYRQELIRSTSVDNTEDALTDPNAVSLVQIKHLRPASSSDQQTVAVAHWIELLHTPTLDVTEPTTQSPGAEPRSSIRIAVMGVTGAGKSRFIQVASGRDDVGIGHDLHSYTSEVRPFEFEYDGHHITLIDTPGFNDTTRSEAEVLKSIAEYLSSAYSDHQKLTGIIYLQSIMDPRMYGSTLRNLKMFKVLVGPDPFPNVLLATTRWGQAEMLDELTLAESRESQLSTDEEFWAPMIRRGARVARFKDTRESAMQVVLSLMHQVPIVLQIQAELVDQAKDLIDTTAGVAVNEEAKRLELKYRAELAQLRQEMDEAIAERDTELQNIIEHSRETSEQRLGVIKAERDLLERDRLRTFDPLLRETESVEANQDGFASLPLTAESASALYLDPSSRSGRPRFVVGVDYGTCYSGKRYIVSALPLGQALTPLIALSFVRCYKAHPEDVNVIRTWPGRDGKWKVPSRIAYPTENETANLRENAWGYLVESNMKSSSWTKLLLQYDTERKALFRKYPSDDPTIDIHLPPGLSAYDVATDFLHESYKWLTRTLIRHFSQEVLDHTPMDCWLTVPDTGSDRACSVLRAAAQAAGFASRQGDTCTLISESAAGALNFFQEANKPHWTWSKWPKERTDKLLQTKNRVMICDCGGGSVNGATYTVNTAEPTPLLEVPHTSFSGNCGSTAVDRNLYALMRKRFGKAFVAVEERRRGPGSRFMDAWETVKRSFGTHAGHQVYEIGPLVMKTAEDSEHYDSDECMVLLTRDDVESLFTPVMTEIMSMVSEVIERGGPIQGLVLTGGFANSKRLFSQFEGWCAEHGDIQLFCPDHP